MTTVLTTDLRDAWRSLRATPIVAAVACTLARPRYRGERRTLLDPEQPGAQDDSPVREPARLAILDEGDWTNPIWEQIRARQHDLGDGAFAWGPTRLTWRMRGNRRGGWRLGQRRIFDVLGVTAARGRTISIADDVPGGGPEGPVAVISYALWQGRYGGTDDVVGRRITVERIPFTIVGVLPSGFFGPDVGRSLDVAIPIGAEPRSAAPPPARSTSGRRGGCRSWCAFVATSQLEQAHRDACAAFPAATTSTACRARWRRRRGSGARRRWGSRRPASAPHPARRSLKAGRRRW